MSEAQKLARDIRFMLQMVWIGVLIALLWPYVERLTGWLPGRDDTDSERTRSNLELLTDAGTGCQYLRPRGGEMTPRLNAKGEHVCE